MTLKQVKPENVNTEIKITGTILTAKKPEPIIKTAVFECKSCMKIHEVKQKLGSINEPIVCSECGSKTFKLIPEECTYSEIQEITVTSNKQNLKLYLQGSLCNYNYNFMDKIISYGILRVKLSNNEPNYYYLEVITFNKRGN